MTQTIEIHTLSEKVTVQLPDVDGEYVIDKLLFTGCEDGVEMSVKLRVAIPKVDDGTQPTTQD